MSLLGLDIGTTGCKALLLSSEGTVLSVAYREYPLICPKPGWVELDPMVVWCAVREVIAEAAVKAGADKVRALSISSHGESITPIGADGVPLYNTITSLDNRTVRVTETWEEKFGRDRLQNITGIPLHHKHSINRIMWFRESAPEIYRSTWKFMCYEDFILYKLGLEPTIDPSLAARTMAYDLAKGCWSKEILSFAGVDEGLLPSIKASGQPVGVLPPEVAGDLGLGERVLAVVGGHDQLCAALGVGIIDCEPSVDSIGTVEALAAVLPESVARQGLLAEGYPCYPHVVPGRMATISVNPNGGALFRWYRDNIAGDERLEASFAGRDPYDLIIEKSRKRPSDIWVLPYFAGSGTPSPNPGLRGAVLGLGFGTTRHDIAWAILESLAFELKINVAALSRLGVAITRVTAVGGGAKSIDLVQLRADVLGLPVAVPVVREAACLGAAMLAGCGLGEYTSLDEAASVLVKNAAVLEPSPEMVKVYEDKFEVYCKVRDAMTGIGRYLGFQLGG